MKRMMKRILPIIITLLLMLCRTSMQATGDSMVIDMRDGLSESRVRSIKQMPDGRMAIATTATIEIYDGTRFHTYKLLPESAFPLPGYTGKRQLTCNSMGYVWLRNNRTLYVADTRRGKIVADVASLMARLGLTPEAVAAWTGDTPTGIGDGDTTAIVRDSYGGLWTGTKEKGIIYSNPARQRQFSTSTDSFIYSRAPNFCSPRAAILATNLAPNATNCTIDDNGEYAYLGTRRGVIIVDRDSKPVATIDETYGLSTNNIQALVRDRRGDVWAATANGISRIRTTGRDSFEITNYGRLDGINVGGREFRTCQIHCDSSGWITVGFVGGICRFHPDSVCAPRYTFRHPRPVIEMEEKATGRVWPWMATMMAVLATVAGAMLYIKKRSKRQRSDTVTPRDEGRKTICTQIANSINDTQPETKGRSADDEFIDKLRRNIEEHIADEDFSVRTLSELMAMDRTVLYRRMQALTGMSPSAYIKSIRMGVAERLLQDTELTIAEKAARTGFSSAKYFSAAFKECFGRTPNGYRKA